MISLKKILSAFSLILMTSCGILSETGKVMRNEKINTTDEFLVKKKEPLTLPPDFAEVPKPGSLEKKEEDVVERKKIEQVFKIEKEKSLNKTNSGSIEDSILKRIDK